MVIVAKYPGRCKVCGGAVSPGDQIEWDSKSRKVCHVQCVQQQKTAEPVALVSGGIQHSVGRNRRTAPCDRCGEIVPAGQGHLVRCLEDSGCPKHHDESGWHVYCTDTAACLSRHKTRREKAKAKLERVKARKEAWRTIEAMICRPETEFFGQREEKAERIEVGSRAAGSETLYIGTERVYYSVSSYDDARSWSVPVTTELLERIRAWQAMPHDDVS